MKKMRLLTCISILTAAMSIGAGLTACNANSNNNSNDNSHVVTPDPDDENKDIDIPPVVDTKKFDEAVKNANAFITKMETSQKFTLSHNLGSATKIIKYDESKTEIQESNTTIYFAYDANDDLYKIAQNETNAWKKSECENHPAPISQVFSILKGVEWKSLEDEKLAGTTKYNDKTADLSVKLASGTCEYSLSYSGIKATGSIYNVENTTITLPEIEDEKPPKDPVIDYDNLTAADLTAEQKATIANNVTTALATNIKKNIGRAGVIKKVIAIDFKENNLTLLLNYDGISGDTIGLYEYSLTSNISYKSLLTNDITSANTNSGAQLLNFSTENSSNIILKETIEKSFSKLQKDGICDFENNADFKLVVTGGTAMDNTLSCAATKATFYYINTTKINRIELNIQSDTAPTTFIEDKLINGTFNKTYRILSEYEYNFSDNALFDFNGLEKQNNSEQEN